MNAELVSRAIVNGQVTLPKALRLLADCSDSAEVGQLRTSIHATLNAMRRSPSL
ncbi:MAG: hypothetical protein ABL985_06030 [Casimicrobium sp.]